MKSVLLVVSIPLLRRGIRTTLENTGEWSVLEATGLEVMELTQVHQPTCVILDVGLVTLDPLEICWILRQQHPTMGILMLAPALDEELFFRLFMRGANTCGPHSMTTDMLVDQLRRASCGEFFFLSEVLVAQPSADRTSLVRATRLHREMSTSEDEEPVSTFPLSSREVEILDYIARGNSNKEIAKSLKISDQTVKNHITSILQKLSVHDRTAAVVHALRHHWIGLEPSGRTVT